MSEKKEYRVIRIEKEVKYMLANLTKKNETYSDSLRRLIETYIQKGDEEK